MRILLIGGTGNISSDCAALLHERGHEIMVLTRGRSAVPPGYRSIMGDRKDLAGVRDALKGAEPEVVINFLGYELGDAQNDYKLFRGMVRQYIFISSTTVYVKPPAHLPITETAPLGNAFWDYAQKKVECERWLLDQHRQNGFPVTIVRPSHTYSKRWIPNPISSSSYTFAARMEQGKAVYVPDDGESPWTLTAASDFAAGLAGLIGNAELVGEAFHITGDEVLTWNQIYGEIATALGVAHPKIVPVPVDFICKVAPQMTGTLKGDKAHPGVFDNSKIKRFVPGFRAVKTFRIGIRESVAWLREHPAERIHNPQIDAVCDEVISAYDAIKKR